MSNKSPGVAHRALDEIVKFQTSIVTDIGKFKLEVQTAVNELGSRYNTVVETIKEISGKHNDLAAHVAAVEGVAKNTAAFAASEIGKMGGSVQRHLNGIDQVTSSIDLNVLALAELSKEVVGQLVQIDALISRLHTSINTIFVHTLPVITRPGVAEDLKIFQESLGLVEADIREIKTKAEGWYGDLVASAFKTVRERIDAEDAAKKEQAPSQETKESVEKTDSNEAELKAIEDEFQKANDTDKAVAATASGGPGSTFPEGAQLFGE